MGSFTLITSTGPVEIYFSLMKNFTIFGPRSNWNGMSFEMGDEEYNIYRGKFDEYDSDVQDMILQVSGLDAS